MKCPENPLTSGIAAPEAEVGMGMAHKDLDTLSLQAHWPPLNR
jgi:hypothetical protein